MTNPKIKMRDDAEFASLRDNDNTINLLRERYSVHEERNKLPELSSVMARQVNSSLHYKGSVASKNESPALRTSFYNGFVSKGAEIETAQ
jgi:hypothetical protein